MNKYYTPSGKFSTLSFIYFILAVLIVLPILSLIYSYLIWYIPFIYINIFIALGFGFAMAFTTNLIIEKGKIRNPIFAVVLAVVVGFIGIYFHWAVWVDLVINVTDSIGNERIGISVSNIKILQVLNLVLDPITLVSIIKEINEFGTWGIRGNTVSGIVLSVFWLIETLVIMYMAVNSASNRAKIPFEESTESWYQEEVLTPKQFLDNSSELIQNIEFGKDEAFNAITNAEDPLNNHHSIFYLYSSKNEGNYLTIENNRSSLNDKNEVEFETTEVVKNIYITNKMVEAIKNIKFPTKVENEISE